MRAGTGFHADQTTGLLLEKLKHFGPTKLASQDWFSVAAHAVQLKN